MDAALSSLDGSPRRGVIAPDADAYDIEVRQISFGKGGSRFRVLYHIVEPPAGASEDEAGQVVVLHIRHTAQRLLTDRADPNEKQQP